jgi:hypothetical protein
LVQLLTLSPPPDDGVNCTVLAKCVEATAQERQMLLKYGRRLGSTIRDLITIVTPRTSLR